MTNARMNVGIASNDRRMFEIIVPNVGKIVCEASTKLEGPTPAARWSGSSWPSSTASSSAKL